MYLLLIETRIATIQTSQMIITLHPRSKTVMMIRILEGGLQTIRMNFMTYTINSIPYNLSLVTQNSKSIQ